MAGAEGLLSGKDLPQWLASLQRPRWYLPLWGWIAAALVTCILQGMIAYRLLAAPPDLAGGIAVCALVVVMAANVGEIVVLDRRRKPAFAFTGLLWFLPPLAVLQFALHLSDRVGAALNWIYVAWVIGYDIPVMLAVKRLKS